MPGTARVESVVECAGAKPDEAAHFAPAENALRVDIANGAARETER